jgi:mannose-6-phosphate isomerase
MENPSARFPVLLKILDCRDKLSVQVHPPMHAAKKLGAEPKTEMWFVTRVDHDAKIYAGLRKGVTRVDFEQALRHGGVEELLHVIPAREGQSLLLPSGRIHALGAGLVIYEIQQNSDSTFRVYDWNRPGLDGKPRELHVAQSMECINFQDFEPDMQDAGRNGQLPGCPHFIVRRLTLKAGESTANLARPDDFSVIGMVRGGGRLGEELLHPGDFRLLPSTMDPTTLTADAENVEWLEITMP